MTDDPATVRGWSTLAPALAFITAMTDVLGWLTLGRIYTANITGDLTQAVSYLLPGIEAHALQVLAGPTFLVGLVLSYLVVRALGSDPRRSMRLLIVAQACLLLVAGVVSGALGTILRPDARDLALGLVAIFTLSLSNATMSIVDRKAATTWALTHNCVLAGTAVLNVVTRYGSAADRARDWATWQSIWPTILAFLAGGTTAVATMHAVGERAWLAPAAVAAAYALLFWWLTTRSGTADSVEPRRGWT